MKHRYKILTSSLNGRALLKCEPLGAGTNSTKSEGCMVENLARPPILFAVPLIP